MRMMCDDFPFFYLMSLNVIIKLDLAHDKLAYGTLSLPSMFHFLVLLHVEIKDFIPAYLASLRLVEAFGELLLLFQVPESVWSLLLLNLGCWKEGLIGLILYRLVDLMGVRNVGRLLWMQQGLVGKEVPLTLK